MKLALIDDEPSCTAKIEQYCSAFGRQNQIPMEISSFQNGETFLETYQPGTYPIVFMDIYLNELNGIATAKKMRKLDQSFFLIFLTSSHEFMPDAFSCHAFDYLTKPISEKQIFQVLYDILKYSPDISRYIEITCNRKTIAIRLNEIISVVSDAHYVEIHTEHGTTYRSRMTSSGFLKLTGQDSRFLPVNKGIIVNADYVETLKNNCCFLTNGTQFPIRIRGYQEVERAYQQYQLKKLRGRQWNVH